jgi:flagellar basal body-associated protein FliL
MYRPVMVLLVMVLLVMVLLVMVLLVMVLLVMVQFLLRITVVGPQSHQPRPQFQTRQVPIPMA